MAEQQILISKEIFTLCPQFKRGIVIVHDLNNPEAEAKLEEILQIEVSRRRSEQNLTHPRLLDWEEIHKDFGSNPNKFPPSIKQLIKRVEGGGALPFINAVVALFNTLSLRHLIPCGGDDLAQISGNLCLTLAQGDEQFTPLGSDQNDPPKSGEAIYVDDSSKQIMCRRWNWRNGDFSKITPATKRMVINLDGGPSTPKEVIESATAELAELLERFCSARLETGLLSVDNPTHHILP